MTRAGSVAGAVPDIIMDRFRDFDY